MNNRSKFPLSTTIISQTKTEFASLMIVTSGSWIFMHFRIIIEETELRTVSPTYVVIHTRTRYFRERRRVIEPITSLSIVILSVQQLTLIM